MSVTAFAVTLIFVGVVLPHEQLRYSRGVLTVIHITNQKNTARCGVFSLSLLNIVVETVWGDVFATVILKLVFVAGWGVRHDNGCNDVQNTHWEKAGEYNQGRKDNAHKRCIKVEIVSDATKDPAKDFVV